MKANLDLACPESQRLTGGLDYYKPTMSQLAYEKYPEAITTFTLKNRGEQRIADYVEVRDFQRKLDERRERGFADDELEYLGGLRDAQFQPIFTPQYLAYIKNRELARANVSLDPATNDLAVATTGNWPLATFWETVVMSDLNEMYFENYLAAHDLNPQDYYDEGDRRLSEKIAILQSRPDIKFADFGTRRHFSLAWQKYVVERLRRECPENLVGTSNVALAQSLDLRPIGTYAHEMPMIYAGIASAENRAAGRESNPLLSHHRQMADWRARYPSLDTALTDTFGTDFFLLDFANVADKWRAVRHDSGDPIEFGEKFISFLRERNIDPLTKTICFSDGLDIGQIVRIADHFAGKIGFNFGWGTTLTNDLGLNPLNIVMKATEVQYGGQQIPTVKLSDSDGKHTGSPAAIENTLRDKADLMRELATLSPGQEIARLTAAAAEVAPEYQRTAKGNLVTV